MSLKAVSHGGEWTDKKLDRVRKYLHAYRQIFSTNAGARYYKTWYIDAFAGTGNRTYRRKKSDDQVVIQELVEEEKLLKGSARIALEIGSPFDRYLFIERKASHFRELEKLPPDYPVIANRIDVVRGDADVLLREWCRTVNKKTDRAVAFLDPFGMEVSWSLLEEIAKTEAVDLWLLFPLFGVNRHLTKGKRPPPVWIERINRVFGTEEWLDEFYKTQPETSIMRNLFDEVDGKTVKVVGLEKLRAYFVKRLETIFAGVAHNPLVLKNSGGSPLFLLCFASSNPKGAATAVGIAQHILRDD